MRVRVSIIAAACALGFPAPLLAEAADDFAVRQQGAELPPYLQCVPFARERSGVQIYGDALTWWDQAAGRYARGSRPKPGAVMAFRPSGAMVLGHVAAVSRVIDSRTVLLDHANWSPVNGRRGQIERGVKAVDVSPANDWSQVRVWYAPLGDLGTTAWPVEGFIYTDRAGDTAFGSARKMVSATYAQPARELPETTPAPSKRFADAFAGFSAPKPAPAQSIRTAQPARSVRLATAVIAPRLKAKRADDPLAAALAKYDR